MHCLIDADSIVFRCGFAVEHKQHKFFIKGEEHLGPFQVYKLKKEIPKEFQGDEGLVYKEEVEIEPLQNALHLVKQELEGIISATGAGGYSVYIKGKGNFREKISVTRVYKGNRDVTHRPKYENEIRQYLKEQWGAEEVDGMEADDKCAIEQSRLFKALNYDRAMEGHTIIASIDKDMDQVPGWHYNFMKKVKYWVTEAQAELNFYMQLLTGDASDNIQGIPKVGPATATDILEGTKTSKEMYTRVWCAYARYISPEWSGSWADSNVNVVRVNTYLTEMANLIYLRRSENDVWQPPN